MSFFRKLFGLAPAPDYKELVKNGAVIIDVRSQAEFKSAKVKGSRCIPLERFQREMAKLPKDKVFILCCNSGGRSGAARRMMTSAGYEAYNAGSWMRLQNQLRS